LQQENSQLPQDLSTSVLKNFTLFKQDEPSTTGAGQAWGFHQGLKKQINTGIFLQ
jgi:hypothetical protein